MIKAILGEKRCYIYAQQISGNRACITAYIYALDSGHQNIGKTLGCFGDIKTQLGGLGWDKVKFKVLHFTNISFSFTLLPLL